MSPSSSLEALGRDLVAAAEAGDWTRVLELDAARTAQLANLANLSAEGREAVRAALESALDVTRRVLAGAELARTAVAEELRALRRGQRGSHAYGDQR